MIKFIVQLLTRFSHINWALADQTMVSGVNFITGLLLARYLGIEEFGKFTLIWMAVLFFNAMHHAVINSPMMSIGPKHPENETPAYFGAVFVQHIIFSLLLFAALFSGAWLCGIYYPEWEIKHLVLPLAASAFAFQLQDFFRRYFFTVGHPAIAFLNDAIRYLGQLVILAGLFIFKSEIMDTEKVLWVIVLTASVAAFIGIFSINKISFNSRFFRSTLTRHWHFSKWSLGTAVMLMVTNNLFVIVSGATLGTSAVGALKATQNLHGVINIIFMGLKNVVPVHAARHYYNGGKDALYHYLRKVMFLGGGVTVSIAAFIAIAPVFWLGLFFSDQYTAYGYLVQWWAIINILMFIGLPLRAGLSAIEDTRSIFLSNLMAAIYGLLLAYPIVDQFGLLGVMVGTTLSFVIMNGTLVFMSSKRQLF